MANGKGLTDRFIRNAKPGRYCDGNGLYLQVIGKSKVWVYRYNVRGRQIDMGLGPVRLVSLLEAREAALEAAKLRHKGIDPIEHRDTQRINAEAVERAKVTFEWCARKYHEAHKGSWSNPTHARDWMRSMEQHIFPVIGSTIVGNVDTAAVLRCLEPIWSMRSAPVIRGRIESVLDFATALGRRTGDNPAKWKANLKHTLPKRSRLDTPKHHKALPYEEIPSFMTKLRALDGLTARALELTILTAARTNATRLAEWSEFKGDVWTVPAERMAKNARKHRVPLCSRALAILQDLPRDGALVFPGVGENALLNLSKKISGDDSITCHGFRSSHRVWSAECTIYPREICEMVLAHEVGDDTEAAYQRSDLFEQRGGLMALWSDYCAGRVTVKALKKAVKDARKVAIDSPPASTDTTGNVVMLRSA